MKALEKLLESLLKSSRYFLLLQLNQLLNAIGFDKRFMYDSIWHSLCKCGGNLAYILAGTCSIKKLDRL